MKLFGNHLQVYQRLQQGRDWAGTLDGLFHDLNNQLSRMSEKEI